VESGARARARLALELRRGVGVERPIVDARFEAVRSGESAGGESVGLDGARAPRHGGQTGHAFPRLDVELGRG
jgi:hypothetical protein